MNIDAIKSSQQYGFKICLELKHSTEKVYNSEWGYLELNVLTSLHCLISGKATNQYPT